MKNVLDVMSLQQHVESSKAQAQALKPLDYRKLNMPGIVPLYIFECATKLKMKPLTAACAAIVYHRFFKEVKPTDYDEFLIAASSLYLAGKIKDDDSVKIRDVINVAYCTLNRGSAPLDLNDEYWSMRDAIVQAELLITRTLGFDLNIDLAHKYLLYYMKTLQDWVGADVWNSVPIAKAAASYLQDFHHSANILKYKPTHVAIGCLSLAMQTYGIQVPLTDEAEEGSMWYKPLVKDFTREQQWEIIENVIEVYKNEALLKAA
ncbi:cyclin-Q [Drosophila obscura]|uniref:cyclin-Q n=1 Tax=Drosophila obscura TaxID=7282 RepID=UPI000BA10494|nr:cyclin-Q [Drosophila obscura]